MVSPEGVEGLPPSSPLHPVRLLYSSCLGEERVEKRGEERVEEARYAPGTRLWLPGKGRRWTGLREAPFHIFWRYFWG